MLMQSTSFTLVDPEARAVVRWQSLHRGGVDGGVNCQDSGHENPSGGDSAALPMSATGRSLGVNGVNGFTNCDSVIRTSNARV